MTTEHSNNQQFIHWSSAQVAVTWREAWVQRPGTQPECLASTEHWPAAISRLWCSWQASHSTLKASTAQVARNLSHWLSLSHTLHAVTVTRSRWGQSVTGRLGLQGPATSRRRVPDRFRRTPSQTEISLASSLSQTRQLELELELWVTGKQPTWPPAGRR